MEEEQNDGQRIGDNNMVPVVKDTVKNRRIKINNTVLLFGVLLLVLALTFVVFKPEITTTITGMFINEKYDTTEVVLDINETYTQDTVVELPVIGEITSIRLNGRYYGEFRIWVNNSGEMLLLSESKKSHNKITGMDVLDVDLENSTDLESSVFDENTIIAEESPVLSAEPPALTLEDSYSPDEDTTEEMVGISDSEEEPEFVEEMIPDTVAEDNFTEPSAIGNSTEEIPLDTEMVENTSDDNTSVDIQNESIITEIELVNNATGEEEVTPEDNSTTLENNNAIFENMTTEEIVVEEVLIEENVTFPEINITENITEDNLTGLLNETVLLEKYFKLKHECVDTCSISINITDASLVVEVSANSTLIIDSISLTKLSLKMNLTLNKMKYNVTKFAGKTTKFELEADLTNVSEVILEKPSHGMIRWDKRKYNIIDADFDKYVDIGRGYAYVDSRYLDDSIDSEAEITLEDIFYLNPVIYRDEEWCDTCEIVSYEDGELTFTVPGFSNYTVGSNTNLSIWDYNDTSHKDIGEQTRFFANYTNITSGIPINGSGAYCNFSENSGGSWSTPVTMIYNATSRLYEYNMSFYAAGNFSFNISCYNTEGYENLTTVDGFEVLGSICEELSSPNVIHYLHSNVNSTGTCFTVTAQNITLDCQGYRINYSTAGGANTYGVYTDQFNTTVKNCNILDGNWTSAGTYRYGIYFTISTNGTLVNNNVNTSNSRAIQIASSYNTILIKNIAESNSSYGIYISQSSNTTLINNTGKGSGASSSSGIMIAFSNNNILTSNTGLSKDDDALFIYNSSYNVLTSNKGESNTSYGIHLMEYSDRNSLINNTGTSNSSLYGIYVEKSSYNNLTSNTGLSTSGPAIEIENAANNNILINNTARSDDGVGLYLYDVLSNVLISNNVTGGSYGYYIRNASYTNISDCIQASGAITDVQYDAATNSIENIFLNCSYNTSKESVVGENNSLIRKWYFDVNVTNSTGSSLNGSNVTVFNSTSGSVYSVLSDVNGDIARTELTEYVNNGTRTYSTPHIVNVTKVGYYDNSTAHNISTVQNVFTTIVLENAPTGLQCGNLSTAGTIYNLSSNVNSTGTCFNITAANITLDCQGYWINYSGAEGYNYSGVYSNQFRTTIKNCRIENFTIGIYFYGADNGTILNNTVNIYANQTVPVTDYDLTARAPAILVHNDANYNVVENNTAYSTYGRGIYLASSSYDTIIGCNASSNFNPGIHLFGYDEGHQIINSYAYSNTSSGIFVYYVNNVTILNSTAISNSGIGMNIEYNNHISVINSTGISIYGSLYGAGVGFLESAYALILGSTGITGGGFNAAGIRYSYSSSNGMVINSTGISYDGSASSGIGLLGNIGPPYHITNMVVINSTGIGNGSSRGMTISGYNNSVINTFVITNGTYGLILESANYSTITNVTTIADAGYGIYIYQSENNVLSNINTTGDEGYRVYISFDNNISDCAFTSGVTNDVYVDDNYRSVNNTFLNCSYDNESVTGASNTLIRKWYFDANVTNSTGSALGSANVTIFNSTSFSMHSELTNSSGDIEKVALTEYVSIGGLRVYSSNYIVNVSKTPYATNMTSYDLASLNNVFATISLFADTIPPSYIPMRANNTIAGESTLFSLLVTDNPELHPGGQYIFSTNNSGVWENDSAVNFTSTPQIINVTKVITSSSIGYRWYLMDNAGNNASTPIYDLIAPAITINSPASTIADVTPIINVSISENGTIWYNIDNGINVTLCTSCNSSDNKFAYISEGDHTLYVYANDTLGNLNNTSSTSTINMNKNYYDNFNDNSSVYANNNVILHIGNISSSGVMSYLNYPSLVSIYYFENSSYLGLDSQGNNNMSSVNGDPAQNSTVPESHDGYSIYLDGNDQVCISAGTDTFQSAENHTVCWWSMPSNMVIDMNQFAQTCGYDTWSQGDGSTYTWVANNCNTGVTSSLSVPNVFALDTWVHICQTYDNTTYNMTIFINGYSNVSQLSAYPIVDDNAIWCIGGCGGGCAAYGNVYRPMWFNDILTADDILSIYSSQVSASNFTSYAINTSKNITAINNVTWTGLNTDENNTITVQVSVDGGNVWYNATSGSGINQTFGGANNSVVYRVIFSGNNAEVTTALSDMNISWDEMLDCGELSVANTVYNLSSSVTSISTCFNITAQNVTLNCNNNSIVGSNSANVPAIFVNSNNAVLRECMFSNWSIDILSRNTANVSIYNMIGGSDYGLIVDNTTDSSFSNLSFSNISITGIWIVNGSHRNSFTNITINSSSNGIYVSGGQNNIFDCAGNNITYSVSGAANTYGIYSNQFNTTIKNCNVLDGNLTNSEGTRHGIYLYQSDNSTLYHNFVNVNLSVGIYLSSGANYNNLTSNIVVSGGVGFSIESSSNYNLLRNNTVISTEEAAFYLETNYNNFIDNNGTSRYAGIFAQSASHNILTNNIFTSNSTDYGIYFYGGTNNTFTNNTARSIGQIATQLRQTSNNTLITHTSIGPGALWLYNATNIVFRDSVNITGTIDLDVSSINNTFINCSYNNTQESISAGTELIRKWYFDVNVTNSTGSALNGSNVMVYNVSSGNVYSELTNLTGDITRTELIEYVNNGTRTYSTPHAVNASKPGYYTNTTAYNISTSQNVYTNIVLQNNPYELIECGNLSAAGSTYTLLTNVTATGTCFRINAANITLDCNDSWITYATAGEANTYGAYAYLSDNVTIKNCNILDGNLTSSQTSRYGILLETTATNSIVYNNYINVSNSRGIYVSAPDFNITSNRIYANTSAAIYQGGGALGGLLISNTILTISGIGYDGGGNNTLISNNITGGAGIMYGGSGILFNNTVRATGSYESGIYLGGSGNNVTGNTVFGNGPSQSTAIIVLGDNNLLDSNVANSSSYAGIQLYNHADNNTLKNNIGISTATMSGIFLQEYCQNNTLINNTGIASLHVGITLGDSSNNILIANNVSGNYGYNLYDSNNTLISDCIYTSGSTYDIRISTNSIGVVFINCSYNISKESVVSDSQIFRKWYFDANVTNSTGSPLNGSNVTVFNSTSGSVYSVLSDVNGDITRTELTEYVNYNGTRTYSTPHNINTTKISYYLNTTIYNITSSQNVYANIILQNNPYELTECGNLGTANAAYYLASNVTATGTCFNVTVANVTLDCLGNWITYSTGGTAGTHGIYNYDDNNFTVKNCNILDGNWTSNETNRIGIYYDAGADNGNIYNNFVNTSNGYAVALTGSITLTNVSSNRLYSNSSSGLYFRYGPTDNYIFNNTIVSISASYAIYGAGSRFNIVANTISGIDRPADFNGLSNSNVTNNTISTIGAFGIFVAGENNTITGNNLNVSDIGIGLYWGASNNTVAYNNVTTTGGEGIILYLDAAYNSIINNTINAMVSSRGLDIMHNSNNNIISNNNIYSATYEGIYVYNSSNNIFIANNVSGNVGYRASVGTNNTVYDCAYTNSTTYDVQMDASSGTNLTFINCSYNISKESVVSGSQLIRKWYFDANVTNSTGSALNGSNVTVFNSTSGSVYSELSDINGDIARTELTEYVNYNGTRTYSTPHTVNVTKVRYAINATTYNITSFHNIFSTIILPNDVTPPSITFESPTPDDGSTVNISTQTIIANITDPEGSNTSAWIDFDRSLVGYWSMDSYNSTGIYDNSSYNNFGVFQNGLNASNLTTGPRGQALTFDGVSGALNVSGSIVSNNTFTLCLWMNIAGPAVSPGYGRLIDHGSLFVSYLQTRFTVSSSDIDAESESIGASFYNVWRFVCIDRVDNGTVKFYYNGVHNSTNVVGLPVASSSNLYIGNRREGGRTFNGTMDEVMIFNRSLSESEIKALYNSKVNKFNATFNNLTEGQHNYTLYAVDEAGNLNTSSQNFILDTSLPCGVLSVANTVYNLSSNVTSVGTCFNITAQNITLDCKGYSITYATGSENNTYGVYTAQLNTTVKNCVIVNGNASLGSVHGIYYDYSDNGSILNNTININANYSYGMLLYFADYINISDNSIINTTYMGKGMYLGHVTYSSISNNNVINTIAEWTVGIHIHESGNHNILSNNTINASGGFSAGIEFQGGTNDTVLSNMHVYGGLTIIDSYHKFTMLDSILDGVWADYSGNRGEWNFTNVTKDNGDDMDIIFGSNANAVLNMIWYFDANVTNSTGGVVGNASVSVYNNNGTLLSTENTDTQGDITRRTLLEYSNYNTSITYYTSHIVNVSKSGYYTNTTIYNITSLHNVYANIVLQNNPYDLTECGVLGIANSIYALSSNVTSTGTCFNITAQNVTLDCNNNWINYSTAGESSTYGIYANQLNTTILDCNIIDGNRTAGLTTRYGIYVSSSNGSALLNNFVNASNSDAIRLTYVRHSAIINNSLISDNDTALHLTYASNNSLANNTILNSSTADKSTGMELYSSSNNTLSGNHILSSYWMGISVYYNSNNNLLRDNNATSYYVGISINSFNNTLINNTARSIGNSAGMYIDNSSNSTILDNIGISAGHYGIHVYATSDLIFANNTGISDTGAAFYVELCLGNVFSGQKAIGIVSAKSIYIYNSSNLVFRDCVNVSGGGYSIDMSSLGTSINNSFINCSYDGVEDIAAGQELIRKWYFDVNVTNSTGYALSSASVNVYNRTSSLVDLQSTNSTGDISRIELTEYINYGGSRSYATPHTVNVTKSGYYPNSTTYNLTSLNNTFATIVLQNNPYELTECGNLGVAGATYMLSSNVTSAGDCFEIVAENVTLDCQGFWIAYSTTGIANTIGIYSTQLNTTIKNCNVVDGNMSSAEDNRYGIWLYSASNSNLANNTVSNNRHRAVYLYETSNTLLENNTMVCGESSGIIILSGTNNTLMHNIGLSSSNAGIDVQSDNCTLMHNIGLSNSSAGISLQDSNHVVINSTGMSNYSTGMILYGTNITVINSTAVSNGVGNAIYFSDGASGNTLIATNATSNASYGIYMDSASNNILRDNIAISGGSDRGIFLYDHSINNTLINTTGRSVSGIGIFLFSSSDNNTFINCTGTSNSNNGIAIQSSYGNNLSGSIGLSNLSYGIRLQDTYWNNLTHCVGLSNLSYGVYLTSASNNTLINVTGNGAGGIRLDSGNILISSIGVGLSSYGVDVSSNNNITNSIFMSNNSDAMRLSSASHNIITNNTIITNSTFGISMGGANNNTFISNILNTAHTSIFMNGAVNNTFIGTNITSAYRGYGIYGGSNYTTIIDCVYLSTTSYDIAMDLYGASVGAVVINCSYPTSEEYTGSGSQLFRKWYFDVNVTNSTGSPLNGSNVTVFNSTSGSVYSELTNTSGDITRTELVEYVNNGTRTYSTPHTVTVAKTGYYTNLTSYNITLSQNVFASIVLKLQSIFVTLKSPDNNSNQDLNVVIPFVANVSSISGSIVNATLYTNESGSWVARQTRYAGEVSSNTSSLVALFRGENKSFDTGSMIYDWTGRGNYATCPAGVCPIKSASGKYGGSMYFTDSEYVLVNHSESFNLINKPFSVSLWYNATSFSGENVWLSKIGNDIYVQYYQDGGNALNFWVNGASYIQSIALELNVWTHMVLIANSSGRYIFINGQLVGTPGSAQYMTTTNPLAIGGDMDAVGNFNEFFDGYIDEVAFFNRSLTVSEILELYNGSKYSFEPVFLHSINETGTHYWNVVATNNESDMMYADNNYTIIISDISPPSITFESPTPNNGTTVNVSNQTITANISDNSNSNTSSWIDFDRSLVGYWAMEYYNASGIYDNSTWNRFAEFMNGLNYSNSTSGARGQGMSFSRINNGYLEIINSENTLAFYNFTVSAWIKIPTTNVANDYYLVSQSSYCTDNDFWSFAVSDDSGYVNHLRFEVDAGTGSYTYVFSTSDLNDDIWHHVLGMRNGANLTLYIDGVFSNSTVENTAWQLLQSEANLSIGGERCAGTENVNGSMDEVMIFNRSLSESEIKALYDSKLNKFNATFTDLTEGQHNYTIYAVDEAGNLNISSQNFIYDRGESASNITAVVSVGSINPIEASQRIISFNFTVSDAEGNNTINVSSASVIVNNSGISRQSVVSSCVGIVINATAQNISCNVSLQYYDPAGVWNINMSIEDTMGNYTENTSTTFTYNTLFAVSLNTNALDFGMLNAGDADVTTDVLMLNNTGNFNYTLIQLKAYNLVNDSYALTASNFRINTTDSSIGDVLSNDTFINITGAILPRSTDSSIGNQSMYIYVDIPLGTESKAYHSLLEWILSLN